MEAFEMFKNILQIIHDDVFMRSFCQYLKRDARVWSKNLKVDSIGSWVDFHDDFLRYWGERKSYEQYLSEFYVMNEYLIIFNKIFHCFY